MPKIKDLPAYGGTIPADAKIPMTDGNNTYSILPDQLPRRREFYGRISQTGTGAPIWEEIYLNTLGGNITWSRTSAGQYLMNSVGLFTLYKTYIVSPSQLVQSSNGWMQMLAICQNANIINVNGRLVTDNLFTSIEPGTFSDFNVVQFATIGLIVFG